MKRCLATSEFALRLAAIFHRRATSVWNPKKEVQQFRLLAPHIVEDELQMVERFYRMNWPPRSNVNHLRHDLAQLINNWQGEVDKARVWCDAHPVRPLPRKIIPLPMPAEKQMTEDERQASVLQFEKLMGRKPKWAQ